MGRGKRYVKYVFYASSPFFGFCNDLSSGKISPKKNDHNADCDGAVG